MNITSHSHVRPIIKPTAAAISFSIRATIASLAAIALAHWLGLHSPQWAGITVWVVAQPSRGMTLSKGFYRLVGTAVGSIVALALIAACSNHPFVFLFLLALWTGFTAAAANLVRYFRSYGVGLAGFTASIVGMIAFSHPNEAYEVAIQRIACVFLGILVGTFGMIIFDKSKAKSNLLHKVRQLVAESFVWPALVFEKAPGEELRLTERRIIAQIGEVEELTTYATAESLQIRMRRQYIYGLIAAVFSIMSTVRGALIYVRRTESISDAAEKLSAEIATALRSASQSLISNHFIPQETLDSIHRSLILFKEKMYEATDSVSSQVLGDRAGDLSSAIERLTLQFRGLVERTMRGQGGQKRAYYRDSKTAKQAGLRSFIAVGIAAIIWQITDWSGGAYTLMLTAVNCSIVATRVEQPRILATAFKTFLAVAIAAALCRYLFLSGDIGPLASSLVLALFLIPGGLLAANVPTAFVGTIFCANFLVFLGPVQGTPFDWHYYLEMTEVFFASVAITYLVFRVVSPLSSEKEIGQTVEAMIADVERMARSRLVVHGAGWETRMYSRVSRLIFLSSTSGDNQSLNIIEGSLAVLDVGRETLLLQTILKDAKLPPHLKLAIRGPLTALTRVSTDSWLAEQQLLAGARSIEALSSRENAEVRALTKRAAGAMQSIAHAISANPKFWLRQPVADPNIH